MERSKIHKASEILKICFNKENLRMVNRYSSVFRDWNSLVGDQYSQHSKVLDLKNNQLMVEVDHSGWIQKLRMRDRYILKRIQEKYPELNICSINYFLKEKKSTIRVNNSIPMDLLSSEALESQTEDVITITDEKLKATLERIRDHVFSQDGKKNS